MGGVDDLYIPTPLEYVEQLKKNIKDYGDKDNDEAMIRETDKLFIFVHSLERSNKYHYGK